MRRFLAVCLAAVALSVCPASASTVLVTSEAGIGATGIIDWGPLGPPLTFLSNPFSTSTTDGNAVVVSQVAGLPQLMEQGTTWAGNFGPGESLLRTAATANGPLTITFGSPVMGAGAQIEWNFYGPFTGTIEAFDSFGDSLGAFSLPGVSNGLGDDSAIFIGILSDAYDIQRVVFGIPDGAQNLAISDVQVRGPVPEPVSFLLIASGGLLVYGFRRRLA
jgi:hypothetical protein